MGVYLWEDENDFRSCHSAIHRWICDKPTPYLLCKDDGDVEYCGGADSTFHTDHICIDYNVLAGCCRKIGALYCI